MQQQLKLAVIALFLGVTSAFAVPAMRGVKKQITLPDGSRVMAELVGDENVNYYRTADGRALKKLNGKYHFVNLDSLKTVGQQRLTERNAARQARARRISDTYTGKKKGLVILVNQTDVKFTTSTEEWNNYFNQVGYNTAGMGGSVHDYFLEQSYGKFDLEFDVVGPVDASHNSVYYSANDGYYVPDLIKEACESVDEKVNFADYDWDNDGYVDQVYVVYAGYGSAQGAEGAIWPHEWKLSASHLSSSLETADGVKVNTYACSCELHGDGKTDTGRIDGIGTACHEFSHCMGLPDFYDTNSVNWGMDVWDLLDYGCYNGGYGYVPCGYTSYERWFAGWLDPIELTSAARISDMPCLHDSPTAYIIYNQANKNEYYLLENRQKKGFDSEMYGHGMLVLHVDYDAKAWKDNLVNANSYHQRMTVIVADSKYGSQGANASGDPFPGSGNVTELTNTSTPAATLYNANSDGEKYMNAPITKIDETDGLITFDFNGGITLPEPPVALEATDVNATTASFKANWEPVDGALSYTVKLTSVEEADPWNFQLFSEDFANCTFPISGTSKDVGSMLDSYTTNAGFTGEYIYRSPNKLRVGKSGTEGWLKTPVIDAPTSGTVTYLIGLLGVSGTADVQMYVETASGTNGAARMGSIPSLASAPSGQFAYYCFTQEPWTYGDYFTLTFYPTSTGNFYIGYVGAFDGSFTWEDFENTGFSVKAQRFDEDGVAVTTGAPMVQQGEITWYGKDGQPLKAPRKGQIVTNRGVHNTTDTNHSITVSQPGTYVYKVRAVTAEGNTDWSNEITVDLTGVDGITATTAAKSQIGTIYDLQGRQVANPVRGLYVRDGKKFMVK